MPTIYGACFVWCWRCLRCHRLLSIICLEVHAPGYAVSQMMPSIRIHITKPVLSFCLCPLQAPLALPICCLPVPLRLWLTPLSLYRTYVSPPPLAPPSTPSTLFHHPFSAGAVLTHVNLISNAAGTSYILSDHFQAGDRHLSYLPLAHIYERVNVVLVRAASTCMCPALIIQERYTVHKAAGSSFFLLLVETSA